MSSTPMKKMRFTQNKAKYYSKPQNQKFIAAGMRGFLATCNFREKDCVREAYNILRTYADELYGPEDLNAERDTGVKEKEESDDDIADQLENEVNAAKTQQKKNTFRRFQRVNSGANNCIFIRTTLDEPTEVTTKIVTDIKSTMQKKTRYLLRLVPIEAVCRIDDMNSIAGKLFDKYFLKGGSSFSIVFNRRLNNDVKRDKVIAELADIVHTKNVGNRVDLKNPDKTILVEIIKGLCLLSVIPGYTQYKKYNLVELASYTNEEKTRIESSAAVTKIDKVESSTENEKVEKVADDTISNLNNGDTISEDQNRNDNATV